MSSPSSSWGPACSSVRCEQPHRPMTPVPHHDPIAARRRNLAVAAACALFVAAMVGMAYAAVPLYTWFCRATGFGGTPQVAGAGPVQVLDRKVTVRFDANVSG